MAPRLGQDSARNAAPYRTYVMAFELPRGALPDALRKAQRRHIKPASTLDQRLEEEAQCLRKVAQGTPPGIQRDMLIRKARQAETTAHMREWLSSPGLQSPK